MGESAGNTVGETDIPAARGGPAEPHAKRPVDVTWERLQDQMAWFDRKSGHAQRRFKQLKLSTLILAAGLPVTVAVSAPSWVPAAMGALIAVIEGAQQLFKFQENWINYRSSCESLRREEHLYLARAGHYAGATDVDGLLADSLERILSQEASHWAERETT